MTAKIGPAKQTEKVVLMSTARLIEKYKNPPFKKDRNDIRRELEKRGVNVLDIQ